MRRRGDRFIDMVTGANRTINHVLGDGGFVFDNGDVVYDLTTYSFIGNDTEYETPDADTFRAVEGKLFCNERPVSTGTLNVLDVVMPCAGGVVLIVASKDKSAAEIFRYNMYEDRFYKIYVGGGMITTLAVKGNAAILLSRTEEPIKVADKEYTSVRERIVTIVNGEYVNDIYVGGANTGDASVIYCNDEVVMFATVSTAAFIEMQDEQKNTFYVEGDGKFVTRIFRIAKVTDDDGDTYYDTGIKEIRTAARPERVDGVQDGLNALVVTEDEIVYTNVGYGERRAVGKDVVETVKAYPYMVRLEPGRDRNVFVLANSDRQTKKIIVTKTYDRGFDTEIV